MHRITPHRAIAPALVLVIVVIGCGEFHKLKKPRSPEPVVDPIEASMRSEALDHRTAGQPFGIEPRLVFRQQFSIGGSTTFAPTGLLFDADKMEAYLRKRLAELPAVGYSYAIVQKVVSPHVVYEPESVVVEAVVAVGDAQRLPSD